MLIFRIVSNNVRGLGNKEKRKAIFEYFRDRADIVCLQETHCTVETQEEWTQQWGGFGYFSNGEPNARGVCTLIKKGQNIKVLKTIKDEMGRYLALELKMEEINVSIINIYAPNKDSPSFYAELETVMQQLSENILIIGDYNLAINPTIDRMENKTSASNNNVKATEQVKIMMNNYALVDLWRDRNKDVKYYSWQKINKNKEIQQASRIDLALVSVGLITRIKNITYLPAILTDHTACIVIINQIKYERGPGYWKMNVEHLKQDELCKILKSEILSTIQAYQKGDVIERWEIIKRRVAKVSQNYARKQASIEKLAISQLAEKLDILQQQMPLTKESTELMYNTQVDLDDLTMKRARGVIFRGRARWYEEGEKITRYFFNLEKERYNSKCCYQLLSESGDLITDFQEVLKLQENFYQDLYTSDPEISFDQTNNSNHTIEARFIPTLNAPLQCSEFQQAVKQMQTGKSPGRDGIPVEFYKVMWETIEWPFMQMIEQVRTEELLPTTLRQGVLNLIPKPNKDSRLLQNLRPITLLNCDYKLIEKVIANRIEPCLHNLIHRDQKGFIRGRKIAINTRKLLDILQDTENKNTEAVILSCDFKKAFDRVEFKSLLSVLEYFKFPENIVSWTAILYRNFGLQVQNNGYMSKEIAVTRGLHQGGPCSSLYFVILVEVLAINMRANKNISGIEIEEIENLLNQFADDLDVALTGGEESLNETLTEINNFYHNTGLALNYDKTTIYRLGSLKKTNAKWYTKNNVNWTSETIKVLGIDVYHSRTDLISKNYDPIVTKIKGTLRAWAGRSLSLIGKITVINTLVASLFVYKMFVLPTISSKIVKQVEDIISKFIWKNRKPKITLRILQNSKLTGGLGLVDLRKKDVSIKCNWIKILQEDESIAAIAYGVLNKKMREDIWRCNIHYTDIERIQGEKK